VIINHVFYSDRDNSSFFTNNNNDIGRQNKEEALTLPDAVAPLDEAPLSGLNQVGVGQTRQVWASPTSRTTAALLILFSEFFVGSC
jgi:hypothetical protein